MSVFSFTGSALNNLVGNTPGANVANLVTCLNDLKTFINGQNLDFTNLAAGVQADYNHILSVSGQATTGTVGTGTYVFNKQGINLAVVPVAWVLYTFYLDPADYALAGRTAKYRLSVRLDTNSTAPTNNWTVGLYPATVARGGAGVGNTASALGSVIAGSAVAYTAPAVNSTLVQTSGDFAAPAAGSYALAVLTNAGMVTNSVVDIVVDLQRRTV